MIMISHRHFYNQAANVYVEDMLHAVSFKEEICGHLERHSNFHPQNNHFLPVPKSFAIYPLSFFERENMQ